MAKLFSVGEADSTYTITSCHLDTNTFFVSRPLCKFLHLKRGDACNFHHSYTQTMRNNVKNKTENNIVCVYRCLAPSAEMQLNSLKIMQYDDNSSFLLFYSHSASHS